MRGIHDGLRFRPGFTDAIRPIGRSLGRAVGRRRIWRGETLPPPAPPGHYNDALGGDFALPDIAALPLQFLRSLVLLWLADSVKCRKHRRIGDGVALHAANSIPVDVGRESGTDAIHVFQPGELVRYARRAGLGDRKRLAE